MQAQKLLCEDLISLCAAQLGKFLLGEEISIIGCVDSLCYTKDAVRYRNPAS